MFGAVLPGWSTNTNTNRFKRDDTRPITTTTKPTIPISIPVSISMHSRSPTLRSRIHPRWDTQSVLPTSSASKRRPSRSSCFSCSFLSPFFALFRRLPFVCRVLFLVVVFALLLTPLLLFEPHVEVSFYSRKWVKEEVEKVERLSGCFGSSRIAETGYMDGYNITGFYPSSSSSSSSFSSGLSLKTVQVHPGIPLRLGMDCYNFAGSIHSLPHSLQEPPEYIPPSQRIQYHTYWRTDLAAFSTRQELMLKSFFATQYLPYTRLILWSNGPLSPPSKPNSILEYYLKRYPDSFELRVVDYDELARGTELEGHELLRVKDTKAWIDGDLVRLLVLWAYGGVWVDMDSLLTRDLGPLLGHEFVTQWDCYGADFLFLCHSRSLCIY